MNFATVRGSVRKLLAVAILISVVAAGYACSGNGGGVAANANRTREPTEFERILKSLKTAEFDYIFVFRRKDGRKMTSGDKKFIREKSHFATNRFRLSRDEKTVFAGSNFEFDKENLAELKERFSVEDFSKPKELIENREEVKNQNTGSNGQTGEDQNASMR